MAAKSAPKTGAAICARVARDDCSFARTDNAKARPVRARLFAHLSLAVCTVAQFAAPKPRLEAKAPRFDTLECAQVSLQRPSKRLVNRFACVIEWAALDSRLEPQKANSTIQ